MLAPHVLCPGEGELPYVLHAKRRLMRAVYSQGPLAACPRLLVSHATITHVWLACVPLVSYCFVAVSYLVQELLRASQLADSAALVLRG